MPLHRRRESVTADEVIALIKQFPAPDRLTEQVVEIVVKMIEDTITAICAKNGIENEPDPH